jgi:hypothetical protein
MDNEVPEDVVNSLKTEKKKSQFFFSQGRASDAMIPGEFIISFAVARPRPMAPK